MPTASDSSHSSPPSRLDDETIDLLRSALRRYTTDGGNAAPLRTALAAATAEARDRAIRAEQVVVIVKELWSSIPEVRGMHDASDRARLQQHVVTMCIREYFPS